MTSILARYRQHLTKTLGDWFPRTALFLKGEPAPKRPEENSRVEASQGTAGVKGITAGRQQ
ncbi:hypothetical protein [Pseudomonas oryzihabitans]|uniref:Uncharacterized protein n=1 Tax=Pseudomonas oryzihabitans TaxID=47885 RepID=A0AAJ2EXI7_9PSED|nr:hypothetical protein [Pseudomonas psychrotolerans]MDR6232260.1 hypothetical protein [Pseudomonas psychrotolerans]